MKTRPRSDSQPQPEDRLTIARALERPASTISREIKHNTCARRGYASRTAQAMARQRRVQAKADGPVAAQTAGADDAVVEVVTPANLGHTQARMHPDDPSARTRRSTTRCTHSQGHRPLGAFLGGPRWHCRQPQRPAPRGPRLGVPAVLLRENARPQPSLSSRCPVARSGVLHFRFKTALDCQ